MRGELNVSFNGGEIVSNADEKRLEELEYLAGINTVKFNFHRAPIDTTNLQNFLSKFSAVRHVIISKIQKSEIGYGVVESMLKTWADLSKITVVRALNPHLHRLSVSFQMWPNLKSVVFQNCYFDSALAHEKDLRSELAPNVKSLSFEGSEFSHLEMIASVMRPWSKAEVLDFSQTTLATALGAASVRICFDEMAKFKIEGVNFSNFSLRNSRLAAFEGSYLPHDLTKCYSILRVDIPLKNVLFFAEQHGKNVLKHIQSNRERFQSLVAAFLQPNFQGIRLSAGAIENLKSQCRYARNVASGVVDEADDLMVGLFGLQNDDNKFKNLGLKAEKILKYCTTYVERSGNHFYLFGISKSPQEIVRVSCENNQKVEIFVPQEIWGQVFKYLKVSDVQFPSPIVNENNAKKPINLHNQRIH